jgi:transcriptional regulator with XRE-family HTH domain
MKCETCGVEVAERRTTYEAPYAYSLIGLERVFLVGIRVRECPECKEQSPIIPRIEELHGLISETLIKKPTALKGEEIKFLRKQAGLPAKEFAALLVMDAAHLSRVENGHTSHLGPQSDRLARALIIAATRGGDMARTVLLEVAGLLNKKSKKAVPQRPTFRLGKEGWQAGKAAA